MALGKRALLDGPYRLRRTHALADTNGRDKVHVALATRVDGAAQQVGVLDAEDICKHLRGAIGLQIAHDRKTLIERQFDIGTFLHR